MPRRRRKDAKPPRPSHVKTRCCEVGCSNESFGMYLCSVCYDRFRVCRFDVLDEPMTVDRKWNGKPMDGRYDE